MTGKIHYAQPPQKCIFLKYNLKHKMRLQDYRLSLAHKHTQNVRALQHTYKSTVYLILKALRMTSTSKAASTVQLICKLMNKNNYAELDIANEGWQEFHFSGVC